MQALAIAREVKYLSGEGASLSNLGDVLSQLKPSELAILFYKQSINVRKAIASLFPNSVTLTEDKFSRQAIESQFKNYNILHLATHASFNTGTPKNSFIIFSNGDKIKLNEISEWQIPNIDLIILSACQTSVGKLGDGVEILGFGYQVQKAGAKSAIASLWLVNDVGTQALIEALRRAQISLIKSPNYNHPNYWSAFFAIGNGL